jgi:hypothetical protein
MARKNARLQLDSNAGITLLRFAYWRLGGAMAANSARERRFCDGVLALLATLILRCLRSSLRLRGENGAGRLQDDDAPLRLQAAKHMEQFRLFGGGAL